MQVRSRSLFPARRFSDSADLVQLRRALDLLPDRELIAALEHRPKGGRLPAHSAHVLWRVLLAGVFFGHQHIAAILAELRRNPGLCDVCGLGGLDAIPRDYHMSRFLAALVERLDLLEAMFAALVQAVKKHLPDLGRKLAQDSTELDSYARGTSPAEESSDPEATWGVKSRKRKRADGSGYESVYKWFGYKLHLLVDSVHELPLAFTVTTAKVDDAKELPPCVAMAAKILGCDPSGTVDRGVFEDVPLAADKAFDQTDLYRLLHDEYGIKPVIDMVHAQAEQGTVYDRDRDTRVRNERTGEWVDLRFLGYEKSRQALKYTCPCEGDGACPFFGARCNRSCGGGGLIVRIKLGENPRYYTAIPRESLKWKREYRRRTAVERVNSRLKQVLNLEETGFRGRKKVAARASVGLILMLAHAVMTLEAAQPERVRSLRSREAAA